MGAGMRTLLNIAIELIAMAEEAKAYQSAELKHFKPKQIARLERIGEELKALALEDIEDQ